MPTELFCSNLENCQPGFFFFQRNYLSFQEGALWTTPQRLMKSLELVSLGEDGKPNRNMSCALLIMTLITPIKMNGGIAVSLLHLQKATRPCICMVTQQARCAFLSLQFGLFSPHFVKEHITFLGNKATVPTC